MKKSHDVCPSCGKLVSVRLDGLFRMHGDARVPRERRTCPGSHQPSLHVQPAVKNTAELEQLRQVRLARHSHAVGEINTVQFIYLIDDILGAP